ncbi:MAG: recombinase RecA [Thermotoga sp. 4484_232]|nr:recombinase RecA [Thermotogaceae bacterium]OQX57127.1 MAG: recombinase RecA [Thermotoga sp. 4484_232]RKX55131.1 MAG: recombinase RecA [Thermotoga sp.]HDG61989.1 recombinase RecA [Thermotoga sp.]
MSEEKFKVLQKAIERIESSFGKGSIMLLGEEVQVQPVEAISTGSLSLDIATGVGGYPRGRIVEIYGPEASGKTTLALHAIAEAQKAGGVAAFVDAEHALDPNYAQALGVDLKSLLISQPDYGEQALEIVDELVRSNVVDLIVIDSVAALVPRAEIEGAMGEMQVGLQARLMSQALRKLAGSVSKSKAIVIFTNQIRMKIGVFFGSPETTTGGLALKFYSTMRIEVRRGESIKEGKDVIGNEVHAKVVKNKVAPPFKIAKFDIIYGKGIARENEVLDLGVQDGFINKKGSWYYYTTLDGKEHTLGQGKINASRFLRENPEILQEIERRIREEHGLPIPKED